MIKIPHQAMKLHQKQKIGMRQQNPHQMNPQIMKIMIQIVNQLTVMKNL